MKVRINGRMKCNLKNRVMVGLLTENPPHSHETRVWPIFGTTENSPVITDAPQNDICPHGRIYPVKAVAINRIKILTPEDQIRFFLKELK